LSHLFFQMSDLSSICHRVFTPRRQDLLELLAGYALVLAALWSPRPWGDGFFIAGLMWVGFVSFSSGASRQELGFSLSRARRVGWVVVAAAVFAVVGAFLALRYGTLHPPFSSTAPGLHASGYLAWAFVQQFILQDFFLARLLRVLPSRKAAVITAAAMFACAHIPNPVLTIATLVWGIVACTLFLRYRDLYSLGVAHAILGLCIAFSIPAAIHHQMHVGLGYLRYHPTTVNAS
jgi:hypothetical protein